MFANTFVKSKNEKKKNCPRNLSSLKFGAMSNFDAYRKLAWKNPKALQDTHTTVNSNGNLKLTLGIKLTFIPFLTEYRYKVDPL